MTPNDAGTELAAAAAAAAAAARVDFLIRELDLRERYAERLREAEIRASDLALRNIDYRLEGMNEFRRQVADSEAKFISREEVLLMDSRASATAVALRDAMEARFRGLERLIYMAAGGVALVAGLLEYFKH